MSTFSLNESLFVIDMDDTSESILPIGETFPDGIKIGEDRDRGEQFTFYISEDGHYEILVAAPALAERWVVEGYLEKRMLQPHFTEDGDIDCYILFSPSSHVLTRLTDTRVYGSLYYAHAVACAIYRSRLIDTSVNLRDGIFCELYNVVLPTYTMTPKVADSALFYNTLRGQYDSEDISSIDDCLKTNRQAGLNAMSVNENFKKFNLDLDTIEPYFQVGELVDDFVQVKGTKMITGPLVLKKEYQIFTTDTDILLLAMSASWAEELIARGLILQMDLKPVQLGREMIKVLALPRRKALEPLNNRHYGINQQEAFDLALAIRRARINVAEANFTDALYVQELGLVLPVQFTGGCREDDAKLIYEIVSVGPFAQGAFLEDVALACKAIV